MSASRTRAFVAWSCGIVIVLVLIACAIYWALVAATDNVAASHRDALAKALRKSTPRAEVSFLAANIGGAVGSVRGQNADVAEFIGSRYVLVRPNGVHYCVDLYALEVIYDRTGHVASTQSANNRQCIVNGTYRAL